MSFPEMRKPAGKASNNFDTWQAPFAGEQPLPGGTRLGIRVNVNAAVTALARAIGEE